MSNKLFRILVLNPGSTSTKLALFENETRLFSEALRHSEADMSRFLDQPILQQLQFRRQAVLNILAVREVSFDQLSAVVGRGGLLKPVGSGTYEINNAMLEDLREARRGEHASNLGAFLAAQLAEKAGAPAFIVDPVSVDEWLPVARLSGLAGLDRECLSHALNTKAICRRFARDHKMDYKNLHLIVAHLGSGFSISAHADGKMIDATNSREEGAFSTERTGTLPVMKLVDLCFSGKHTRRQIETMIFRKGGVFSYLETKDLAEVLTRIGANDRQAKLVFDGLIYQVSKEIAAMAAVLSGKVDAILLTGGLVHSSELVEELKPRISWIAGVHSYPGEDELSALAEGALRVLRGEEDVKYY